MDHRQWLAAVANGSAMGLMGLPTATSGTAVSQLLSSTGPAVGISGSRTRTEEAGNAAALHAFEFISEMDQALAMPDSDLRTEQLQEDDCLSDGDFNLAEEDHDIFGHGFCLG